MKRIDTLIHAAHREKASILFADLNVPVTLREVKTVGRRPPRREVYRGTAYYSNVTPELEITAIVPDARLEEALAALEPLTQGGAMFVSTVEAQAPRPYESKPRAVTEPKVAPTATPRASSVPLRVALART